MKSKSLRRLISLIGVLSLVLAACGDGDNGGDAAGGAGSLADISLDGVDIAVGSKDFTEQLVLGQIMVKVFEALGANVTDRVDLGGTNVARQALLSGEIDTYMEYNGTGYSVHLGIEDEIPTDPDTLTEIVRERDLAANGIHWLSRSPFNNTYGFASSPEVTEANGGAFTMQTMADYLAANPDAIMCLESEFPSRPDGLILFEEATGYTVPQNQIEILDTGVIYTETANNNCEFGEIFTTDGRIPALGLTVVEDPGVMILYNVSMGVRDDAYQQAPAAFDAIAEAILAPLDNDSMQELNRQVNEDGLTPAAVAERYLIDQGLIQG
ncbi:MAG TPA: glycine betaine ABC transporter substrate-binding protein [Acidimicrobiia bacterium]|nr:glycine betaine ABC transporter substrate-binding protein [Acidimicrobiia bacterium]